MDTPQAATNPAPEAFAIPNITSGDKGEKSIMLVEVMNGIVFAVMLILFGIVWGTFASTTFAGI